jgi:hypothetical protein
MQMSIHRSLAQLKLLESRIHTAMKTDFTALYKKDKAPSGFSTIEEFEKNAVSKLDSVESLIERRNQIRSAIVASNANTDITVGTKTYKVAEAINRKTDIKYEIDFLSILKNQYGSVTKNHERILEQTQRDADDHIIKIYGNKTSKDQESEMETTRKNFLERTELKISDPIKIREKIDVLEKEIQEFISEVDSALSESNARTTIEISDTNI